MKNEESTQPVSAYPAVTGLQVFPHPMNLAQLQTESALLKNNLFLRNSKQRFLMTIYMQNCHCCQYREHLCLPARENPLFRSLQSLLILFALHLSFPMEIVLIELPNYIHQLMKKKHPPFQQISMYTLLDKQTNFHEN